MKPVRPYTFGFWMFSVIVIVKLALMIITAIRLQRLNSADVGRTSDPITFVILLVLFAEAIFYWYRRYYIPSKRWVLIHSWTTLGAMVILPLTMALVMPVLVRADYESLPPETEYFFSSEYESLMAKAASINGYVFWGLLGIGHIFFIATIVKSFLPIAIGIKEPLANESTGLLDEFTDRR